MTADHVRRHGWLQRIGDGAYLVMRGSFEAPSVLLDESGNPFVLNLKDRPTDAAQAQPCPGAGWTVRTLMLSWSGARQGLAGAHRLVERCGRDASYIVSETPIRLRCPACGTRLSGQIAPAPFSLR